MGSMHVIFEGIAAHRLWENVKDYLDLLRLSHELQRKGDGLEAERAMQAFMWICYAGGGHVASQEILGNEKRKNAIESTDQTFYRVVRSRENLTVQVNLEGGRREILEFGNAIGYSAVVSLSDEGYHCYLNNDSPGYMLMENAKHMKPYPQNRRSSEFIYISSVVHVPSLRRLFASRDTEEQPLSDPVDDPDECFLRTREVHRRRRDNRSESYEGMEVFETTLKQIQDLIVLMKFDDKGHLVTKYADSQLPVILCPISGGGDGALIVGRCGLWPVDRDMRRHLRYKLDFARYNADDASDMERELIRNAVKKFSREKRN